MKNNLLIKKNLEDHQLVLKSLSNQIDNIDKAIQNNPRFGDALLFTTV